MKTQLSIWLTESTPTEKRRLAEEAGVSLNYLYMLSSRMRDNPPIKTAGRIVGAANALGREGLPILVLEDFLY